MICSLYHPISFAYIPFQLDELVKANFQLGKYYSPNLSNSLMMFAKLQFTGMAERNFKFADL
jgi:hypothetical protein